MAKAKKVLPEKAVPARPVVPARTEKVVEATMVATRTTGKSQLGAIVSEAMQKAIQKAMDEGHFAPQVIKEKMMAAREGAISAYDEMHRSKD